MPLVRQQSHDVFDEHSLAEERLRLLAEVAHVLLVPLQVAGVLLVSHRWDVNKLMEQYSADPEKCLAYVLPSL